MPDNAIRHGGCACGKVRYQVGGAPFRVGLCHCTDCRKETGSVFTFYADWVPDAFSHSGDVRTFNGRSFCPECGSHTFNFSEDHIEIRLGSLDEAPGDLVPTCEGWIQRREPWLAPVAGAAQCQEDVPPAGTSQ
jgi:hypothetical protein